MLLESEQIKMGEKAREFSLVGTDDKKHTLGEFEKAKVLVVVFMCNHCPYVQAVWGRLVKLQERFGEHRQGGPGKGVQFVGINPNLNPAYPEEDLDHMKEYYHDYSMNFPYLLDETQEVAKAYGAVCTPDIFVYDGERRLVYRGRIDDSWQEEKNVTKEELAEVIELMLEGGMPGPDQKPSMGCSIKWREL